MKFIFKKSIAIALCLIAGTTYTFASDNDNRAHVLMANNVYAMTLTKLTVSDTLAQCQETLENFKAVYPDESRVKFACIALAEETE